MTHWKSYINKTKFIFVSNSKLSDIWNLDIVTFYLKPIFFSFKPVNFWPKVYLILYRRTWNTILPYSDTMHFSVLRSRKYTRCRSQIRKDLSSKFGRNQCLYFWAIVCFSTSIISFQNLNSKSFQIWLSRHVKVS